MRRRLSTYLNRPSTGGQQTSSSSLDLSAMPIQDETEEKEETYFGSEMAFDEVSSPVLAYKFSGQDFDPEKYVKNLVSTCDVKRSLVEHRNKIQTLSDETAVSMKKNVYRNYRQFIDTSKEISYLEAEMYQLSHMLTEQKTLINDQVEMNIFDSSKEKEETIEDAVERGQNKRGAKLSEIIAGCKDIIANRRSPDIIRQGSLTGIDPDSYATLSKVELFILEDYLVIAFQELERDAPKKYKFNTMFDLNDVGIVNVRDGGGVRNCFKVLHGLDIWMFGAENRETKLQWLEALQNAKKDYRKVEYIPPSPQVQKRKAPAPPPKQETKPEEKKPDNQVPDLLNVDWLIELPDDLDMCIAQRSFDAAVKLVEKANSYLQDFPETTGLKDYKERINRRVKELIEALEQSLDNSTTMRHISLRSIRQYISLLIRLGRAKLACELFLRNRGFAMKHSIRQLKIEGSTVLYITKLANVFFTSVVENGKEFRRIFTKNSSASAFVVWAHKELQHFVSLFARQVFSRKSSLAAIAVCIEIATKHCKKLLTIGMDLAFAMHHMFLKHLMEAMFDNRDQLISKAKHLGSEELWKPTDYTNNVDDLYTVIGELESLGVSDAYSYGTHQLLLSKSVAGFTKGLLIYFEDGMKLYTPQLHNVFIQCLTEIFKTQALLLEFTIKSDRFKDELEFISKNIKFVFNNVLPIIERKIEKKVGHPIDVLKELHEELPRLEKIISIKQKRM
ncbi:exocyst complex component 8-like isoform X2 [Rhopilema esculentum]|uniref:exocyst complex component 8-like isoform X2 n=1 Tax=Rhopilema esculentum TaxID=499914 RepID=UPI0031D530A9